MGLLKTHQECLFFSWEILLKKQSVIRSMDTATQMLDCDETITKFGVKDLVLGLKECENSHTLTFQIEIENRKVEGP